MLHGVAQVRVFHIIFFFSFLFSALLVIIIKCCCCCFFFSSLLFYFFSPDADVIALQMRAQKTGNPQCSHLPFFFFLFHPAPS